MTGKEERAMPILQGIPKGHKNSRNNTALQQKVRAVAFSPAPIPAHPWRHGIVDSGAADPP